MSSSETSSAWRPIANSASKRSSVTDCPQLLPPTRRGDRHRHVGELDQRPAAPQTERAVEAVDGRARPAVAERRPALPRQPFEPERVDVVVGDVEEVPGRAGHDPVGTDRLADLEHDHLEGVRRLLQIPLGPQALDQSFGGRHHPRPQREQGQERALTEPDERDRLTTLVANVERAEQTDLHGQKLPASHDFATPPPELSASDCQGRHLRQTERWGHGRGARAARPRNAADSPRSASIRSSWLYLATRSLRAGAPVLIWPQLVATARSAIVASSVSPLRWLITDVYAWRVASSTVSSVSVSEPIWLTLMSTLLATLRSIPIRSRWTLVTNRSSPTSWTRVADARR